MKNLIILLFLCSFLVIEMQAQNLNNSNNVIEGIAVMEPGQMDTAPSHLLSYSPIKSSPTNKAVYQFDFDAGQHTAYFEDLDTYVSKHLRYPETARPSCIEGVVKILVITSSTGKVTQTEVIESLGEAFDRAALDMINRMPKWTPAMNYGVPVKGKKIIEIRFRLQ